MIQFIHIPKCAGAYVNQYLGLPWRGHLPMVNNNKTTMTILRNPIEFYKSLYYFFKSRDNVLNKMKFIAMETDLNEFIDIVIDSEKLTQWFRDRNMVHNTDYDKFHMKSTNGFGLYTNYLMFFCNPHNFNTIDQVISFMTQHIEILYFENLDNDLNAFIQKHNVPCIAQNRHNRVNVSTRSNESILSNSTIELIKTKDCHVFKNFYPL